MHPKNPLSADFYDKQNLYKQPQNSKTLSSRHNDRRCLLGNIVSKEQEKKYKCVLDQVQV